MTPRTPSQDPQSTIYNPKSSELAFRRKHPLNAGIERNALRQRAGERFEERLDDVVRVAAVGDVEVERQPRIHGDGAKKVLDQFRVEFAQLAPRNLRVENQMGTTAKIQNTFSQRLLHGNRRLAEPLHARFVSGGGEQRLSQRDAKVLDRMMRVNVQIPLALDLQIEQSVARQEIKHMIHEPHADRSLESSAPVQVDRNLKIGFLRLAANGGFAALAHSERIGYSRGGIQKINAGLPSACNKFHDVWRGLL